MQEDEEVKVFTVQTLHLHQALDNDLTLDEEVMATVVELVEEHPLPRFQIDELLSRCQGDDGMISIDQFREMYTQAVLDDDNKHLGDELNKVVREHP